MAKDGFLIFFPLLLLLCGSAQSSGVVKVSLKSLQFLDGDQGDCSAASTAESGFSLSHIDGKCSPFRSAGSTWRDSIFRSIERDAQRYRALTQRGVSVNMPSVSTQADTDEPLGSGPSANYIIKLGFGMPAQSLYTVVDTGSDIAWIPCSFCTDCPQNASQRFDPSKSPSFKFLGCSSQECQALGRSSNCSNFNCSVTQAYGDGSQVDELLSTDTVALGSQAIDNFIFGCASSLQGLIRTSPGLVGFGRDALSFVSQTASFYNKIFSYCLPSVGSSTFTGSLHLGNGALDVSSLHFTPLLTNAANPSFYYVGLNGISINDELVSVPPGTFDLDNSNGKGTIIDSGTVITRLVQPAYNAMRDSFRRHMTNLSMANSTSSFDTCYNFPEGEVEVPQITLHFDGGLDWVLPAENSLIATSSSSRVACLAFALPPGNSASSVMSIIGNFQQQNFRIVHDLPGSRLGIAPENCSSS
uniref:Peptidase A1 domain-containing protein n=1 Tax=Araucaria cunninghamii TaxID=56994 RepID=A0A0D6QT68_ARACU